jgi:hypothetical protein
LVIPDGLSRFEHSSPEDFDFVDDLFDAFHIGNGFLGELFEIETRHLSAQYEPSGVEIAPNPLHGQVRLVDDSTFGGFGDLLGLIQFCT